MWDDINLLRTVSVWLQWTSIALVFVSGCLQVGKFVIDRREKALVAIEQRELAHPGRQLVATGSATVEVYVQSTETFDNRFMDQGGYLAFGRGNDALMTLTSTECIAKQLGNNQVLWRGVFSLDATDVG